MSTLTAGHAGDNAAQALQLIERFLATANDGNPEGHARTLNYPHVLINDGSVSIWHNLEELRLGYLPRLAILRERGWARSVFDSKQIIQSDGSTFHIAAQFTRYDRTDAALGTYQALYIVNCVDGHWGIQARSNFVPEGAYQR